MNKIENYEELRQEMMTNNLLTSIVGVNQKLCRTIFNIGIPMTDNPLISETVLKKDFVSYDDVKRLVTEKEQEINKKCFYIVESNDERNDDWLEITMIFGESEKYKSLLE